LCRIRFICSETAQTDEFTSGTLKARPTAILFVYDLNKASTTSFINLYLCRFTWSFTQNVYIVGNKLDQVSRDTTETDATQKARLFIKQMLVLDSQNQVQKKFRGFHSISAITGENVDKLFISLTRYTYQHLLKPEHKETVIEKLPNLPRSFLWIKHRTIILLWQLVVQGRATLAHANDPLGLVLVDLFQMPADIIKKVVYFTMQVGINTVDL